MPISSEVPRTIKRADNLGFKNLALCKLCGPSEIFSDNRGVVQAVHEEEVKCIGCGHRDADLWILLEQG